MLGTEGYKTRADVNVDSNKSMSCLNRPSLASIHHHLYSFPKHAQQLFLQKQSFRSEEFFEGSRQD